MKINHKSGWVIMSIVCAAAGAAYAGEVTFSQLRAHVPDGIEPGVPPAVSAPALAGATADYHYQRVRAVSKGPALVAGIGAPIMDQRLMIGYRKSGVLGGHDKISAVVKVTYYGGDGRMKTSEKVIDVPREWRGTGFMTPVMRHHEYINLPDNTGFRGISRIELAFFYGSEWDSNYGANYAVTIAEMAQAPEFVSPVYSPDSYAITAPCWDYIAGQMALSGEKVSDGRKIRGR